MKSTTTPASHRSLTSRLLIAGLFALLLTGTGAAWSAQPPCNPCAGLTVENPLSVADALAQLPTLQEDARLYVRWLRNADAPFAQDVAGPLVASGATPWLGLRFDTPAPVLEHLDRLNEEIEAAVETAKRQPQIVHFQVFWNPSSGAPNAALSLDDYTFLFKRVSVALRGATAEARVLPQPLPADVDALRHFYELGNLAYLDGISFAARSMEELQAPLAQDVIDLLADLDPGRPIVIERPIAENSPTESLAIAARLAAQGASVVLFDVDLVSPEILAPLVVLANEFQGDLSYDPHSSPTGDNLEAWAFVRGEDLSSLVIVSAPDHDQPPQVWFSDPSLRNPQIFDLATGERHSLFGLERGADRLGIRLEDTAPVAILNLERPSIEDLQGVEERVDVSGDKITPVEEILRRLQAFEDAQARRLDHYQAVHTNHLRFEGATNETLEVAYEGDYFYQREKGFDWAWQRLFINGVRWRKKTLPEIPILQPERAAAAPLEIHFTPEFRYRLRGTERVEDRDCWVIDFEPGDAAAGTERKLQRGTVWVDREHSGRVKLRTVQLGLTGDVLSNEETVTFTPVDALGQPADWTPEAFWLPLHSRGQQILTVLNEALVVEREGFFTELKINSEDYVAEHSRVLDSEATMVRDTEKGLRYLTKEKDSDERVVQEGFDSTKLFLVGGVFYDDAADFPIPLAGIDYLDLDFRGKGQQVNVFFAGVLLNASISDPSVFGSRFDLGASAFALGIPFTDETARHGEEAPEEDVDFMPASVEVAMGLPIGNFFRLGLEYGLTSLDYKRADDTADDFVLPSDHFIHSFEFEGRYSRNGYRLNLVGSYNLRDEWEAWGTPEQVAAFDPDTDQFYRYSVRLAKSWYLSGFQKFGAEVAWVGGERLDRFNKYEFGSFSSTRIHGYQSSRTRAEEAALAHLSYGKNIGELFRIEGLADMALASDEETGLDNELLAGLGLSGSFLGPWGTIVRVDAGVAVAGPDDGFGIELLFLKLFR